jgi:membrane protein required for colicin V production
MSDASIVNVVILGVLAIGAITGGIKGFARQMIELVGLVVSFFVAAVVATWLAAQLSKLVSVPHAPALVIAFLTVFVAGLVAFHFVAISAQRIAHMSLFGWVDRLCGALVGLLAGILVASVLVTVLVELPVPDGLRSALERSSVGAFVQPVALWLFNAVFPQDKPPVAAGTPVHAAVASVVRPG